MFVKKTKRQKITSTSDFDEFLKVLDDLEGQGDHVAIDSSVTKRSEKNINQNNHEEDNFYFDFSGDLNNLKKGFLSNMKMLSNSKEKKCLSKQNDRSSASKSQTRDNKLLNSSSSTETYSDVDQEITLNTSEKNIRKNKNVYVKYKYNDNYEHYLGLNNKLRSHSDYRNSFNKDISILQRQANDLKKIDINLQNNSKNVTLQNNKKSDFPTHNFGNENKNKIPKKESPTNIPTYNLQETFNTNIIEYCPSLCGSTDEDLTDDTLNFSELRNNLTVSNSEQSPHEIDESIERNHFKTPIKHKKFKTISTNNWFQTKPLNFIEIRENNDEMSSFVRPKKFKMNNNVNTTNTIQIRNCDNNTLSNIVNIDHISSSKKRKRISSESIENTNSSFEDYIGKKRLKFVSIEDSDCEMSLYSKTKKKKHKNKEIKNISSEINENTSTPFDSCNAEERLRFVNIGDSDCEMSLYSKPKKKKHKNKEIKNISSELNENTSTPFDSCNAEDRLRFVNIEDSDCEMSLYSKTKKKMKVKKKKHKDKEIKNISSESNENISTPFGSYNGENKLKFVNIEDSDCEMFLYNKEKKKMKSKKKKHKKKEIENLNCDTNNLSIENVSVVQSKNSNKTSAKSDIIKNFVHLKEIKLKLKKSKKLTKGNNYQDDNEISINTCHQKKLSTLNNSPAENCQTDIEFEAQHMVNARKSEEGKYSGISLLSKIKKKSKKEKDNCSVITGKSKQDDYEFWKRNLKKRTKILSNNGIHNNSNLFKDYESSKISNFVDKRSNDSEISMLTKIKKKKKLKYKKDRFENTYNEINQSKFVTDVEFEKQQLTDNKYNNEKEIPKKTNINKTTDTIVKNDTYDFKFNNIEEIKKDFDTSGISFEEDLSVVEQSTSLLHQPTINKEETTYQSNKMKLSEESERVIDIKKFEEEKNKPIKEVNMPDLDLTRLSVLVDLKSAKENSLAKSLKLPRRYFSSESTENKLFIKVCYADSHKCEKYWNIGIRNIKQVEDSSISKETSINESLQDLDVGPEHITEKDTDTTNEFKETDIHNKYSSISTTGIKNENIGNHTEILQNVDECSCISKETDNNMKTKDENTVDDKICKSECHTTDANKAFWQLETPEKRLETSLESVDSKSLQDDQSDIFSNDGDDDIFKNDNEDIKTKDELQTNEVTNEGVDEDIKTNEEVQSDEFTDDDDDMFEDVDKDQDTNEDIQNDDFSNDDDDLFEEVDEDQKTNEDKCVDIKMLMSKCSTENISIISEEQKCLKEKSSNNNNINEYANDYKVLKDFKSIQKVQPKDDNGNIFKVNDGEIKASEENPIEEKSEAKYDTPNMNITSGALANSGELLGNISNNHCKKSKAELKDSKNVQEIQSSESGNDDNDDVFEDELKSEDSSRRNLEESLLEDQSPEFGNDNNLDTSTYEPKTDGVALGDVFRDFMVPDNSQFKKLEESGSETVSLESLKSVQHTSITSNFDDIILSDENTTLQNINIEDLKQTFSGENSLENKPLLDLNSTENFRIVSQPESDNENNINSMLIFEDVNSTVLTNSQNKETKFLSKIDDQIIMDLEAFMDLQNVDELFNNLTEKEKEDGDIDNISVISSTDHLSMEKSTGTDKLSKPVKTEEYFKSESKGKEEITESNQIKQPPPESDTEHSDNSDVSNYSDELKSPSRKRRSLRKKEPVTSPKIEIQNQTKKTSKIKNEVSISKNSDNEHDDDDDNDTKNSKWFLKKLDHASDDSDFFDDSTDENDFDTTDDEQQKDLLSNSHDEADEKRSGIKETSSNELYRSVTEDDLDNIRDLRIKLSFTPSPLHQSITRTTSPSKAQYDAVRKANIYVKLGPFSSEEDEIIKKNWESFLEEYKLDVPPTALFKFPRKMRLEQKILFIKYLSRGLDSRWPHLVYERFRNIYLKKKWKVGRYTKQEDKIMLDFLAATESKQPYKDLEKILNRPSYSIIQRFNYYQRDKKKITRWSLELVEKFVKNLLKITKCKEIEELRHRKFSEDEWRKLAKHMKNGMTAHQVKYSWKSSIHFRLFSDDVPLPIVKAELLKRLEDANVSEWKHINWEEIAKDFHGYNSTYLCLAFIQTTRRIPPVKRKNLKECLSILRKKFPTETPSQKGSKAHKKLKYENGRLMYRDGAVDKK